MDLSAYPHQYMSREVEDALLAKAQKGDWRARNRVIENNLLLIPFALAQALPPAIRHRYADDLFQAGAIGMMRAVDLYRPDGGTRFAGVAVWWIRAEAWRWYCANKNIVRRKNRNVSVESDVGLLDDAAPPEQRPDMMVEEAEALEYVRDLVRRFPGSKRDRLVIKRRQLEGATLEDVAQELGLSRERVRQLESGDRHRPGALPRFNAWVAAQVRGRA